MIIIHSPRSKCEDLTVQFVDKEGLESSQRMCSDDGTDIMISRYVKCRKKMKSLTEWPAIDHLYFQGNLGRRRPHFLSASPAEMIFMTVVLNAE